MKLKLLNEIFNELMMEDIHFYPLARLIGDMSDAEDGDIAFSCGNIGINITKDTIDIVDIFEGKSVATLKLELKED